MDIQDEILKTVITPPPPIITTSPSNLKQINQMKKFGIPTPILSIKSLTQMNECETCRKGWVFFFLSKKYENDNLNNYIALSEKECVEGFEKIRRGRKRTFGVKNKNLTTCVDIEKISKDFENMNEALIHTNTPILENWYTKLLLFRTKKIPSTHFIYKSIHKIDAEQASEEWNKLADKTYYLEIQNGIRIEKYRFLDMLTTFERNILKDQVKMKSEKNKMKRKMKPTPTNKITKKICT